MERIARFHCEFQVIHPFVDAYARTERHDAMTRLLALLVLEALPGVPAARPLDDSGRAPGLNSLHGG